MTQSVTAVNTDIAFLNRRVRFQVKTTKNEAMPRPIDEIKANCLPGDFFLSRDDRHQKSSQVLLCRMCNEQTQSRAVSLTTRAICFFRNSGEVPLTTLLQVRVLIRIGENSKNRECLESNFISRVSAHVLCLPTGQKFSKETSMNGHHSNANLHSVRAVFYDLKAPTRARRIQTNVLRSKRFLCFDSSNGRA